ncbi:MAG: deoxyguanosinetriphosphate triphosphohydrolase [Caldisericia bacterium]|nr:deoxyguanosinetriphosphate triphosphohydrolase [Caldisericia bacterium]
MPKQQHIRILAEKLEEKNLSPFATLSKNSKGRIFKEEKCEIRTEFQRDRDRIIHSKSFRRLKDKTQVFFFPLGDHYRTRLTHVLEVSQIARVIGRALRLNEDLIEAISLGHDLGHSPFGHIGEEILDKKYKEFVKTGGFKHNEQSLRVVDFLEEGYGNKKKTGLNLTWETRDGILMHSKGLKIIKESGIQNISTLEGEVVAYADRIAYLNHDLDDAIRGGVIKEKDIPKEIKRFLGKDSGKRIDKMVKDLIFNFLKNHQLKFSDEVIEIIDLFLNFLKERLYYNKKVRGDEIIRIEKVISDLFDFYMENPNKILNFVKKYEKPICFKSWEDALDNIEIRARYVCDYISGMSDEYLILTYNENFFPKPWRT